MFTYALFDCNPEAKKKTLTKWVYLFLYKESEPLCVFKDFLFFFAIIDSILNLTNAQFRGMNLVSSQNKTKYIF
jgi:hypothetical protein